MADPLPRFSRVAEDLISSFRRVPVDADRKGRSRAERTLAELVDSLCNKHGIGRETPEQALRVHWSEIVGPANATYSHAVRITPSKRLQIQASHAVVRDELSMNKQVILERIRAIPGCADVASIYISIG